MLDTIFSAVLEDLVTTCATSVPRLVAKAFWRLVGLNHHAIATDPFHGYLRPPRIPKIAGTAHFGSPEHALGVVHRNHLSLRIVHQALIDSTIVQLFWEFGLLDCLVALLVGFWVQSKPSGQALIFCLKV
mmetsp:Transcript_21634/g.64775  ORF Transcript_21634/g.64775 Transcript_21634/m.64775 type:complete len:130 (-) Transcript_21634:2289-2678(-)